MVTQEQFNLMLIRLLVAIIMSSDAQYSALSFFDSSRNPAHLYRKFITAERFD